MNHSSLRHYRRQRRRWTLCHLCPVKIEPLRHYACWTLSILHACICTCLLSMLSEYFYTHCILSGYTFLNNILFIHSLHTYIVCSLNIFTLAVYTTPNFRGPKLSLFGRIFREINFRGHRYGREIYAPRKFRAIHPPLSLRSA